MIEAGSPSRQQIQTSVQARNTALARGAGVVASIIE
jgi:hypothetical protein